jgi:hypothetical protein
MNNLDAILIIKWEIPGCVVLHKSDNQIARNEFETKEKALEFCLHNGITIQEIIGKGWKERVNGTMGNGV